ncbi:MAG: methyltransferase domain-containing protein [Elusimicrobiota bacterium]|jgi:SAM-dependent methyltransferase|nr:methyltransferase domain-containing protein [Elusimicrobiota bacterium]
MKIVKLIVIVVLFFPVSAYAYLDPGTGNALLAALFGLIGSAVFFSKNIYYKIKGIITGKKENEAVKSKLAIFCESRRYWIYFKDIVAELIKMKIPFTYYTLDIDDPALDLLDYGNPNADFDSYKIKFVGGGNKGYAAISNLKEPYILATTPNIGTPGYPIKKPKTCKNLIHIFHSIGGVASYKKYSLDCYDTLLIAGKAFESDIRYLEEKRNLPHKQIFVAGLPYLDSIISRSKELNIKTNGNTILIASTWNKKGCLQTYGSGFIINLAKAGYDVIVRPHPYSYVFEPDFIKQLKDELKGYSNITFDDEIDNLKSLAKADILISDVSGIRLDYYFTFNRPVVSLESDSEISPDYEHYYLQNYWSVDISDKIGVYIRKEEINDLVEKIKNIKDIQTIDKEYIVANTQKSAIVITDILNNILNSQENKSVIFKNYWEDYYKSKQCPVEPSLFARYCLENYIKQGNELLELGCGNGRDALFFSRQAVKVVAVDQCDKEIGNLKKQYSNTIALNFVCDDFTRLNDTKAYDVIYSRFTMHAIDEEQENKVISYAATHLAGGWYSGGGYLLIEVRGLNNELYGKGEKVENEKNAFIYDGHYRRFINQTDICNKLIFNKFSIILADEKRGRSPYNGKDEIFMRIIAKKLKGT